MWFKKRGTAALWKAVNNLTKGPRQPETGSEITEEELNDHYARVSTDPHYAPPALRSTAYNKREDFTEAEIFYALDRLRPTSEGADRSPSWFLKIVAPICSSVLTHLTNRSLGSAHVPEQWKLAFQEPPMCDDIADQFAFRPTGSTAAAIIELLQQTTDLLLTNDFVVIISTDFSRAFDTVRHSEMMKKYGILVLPDHIVNWLTGYFAERAHITKFQGIMSAVAFINASVVQGSGIGPSSYILVSSHLKPINRENK